MLVQDNTYTATTTVNDGSLIVDGSIASAQTLVNASGLLGGNGFLRGNLVNSGIVSRGGSPAAPGTLTVSGNYTQNANGTLRIEVAGLALSRHDLLAVGGHASFGGTLQLIPLSGFQLHAGDKLTFLTANGGVSGTFSTIQNEFSTLVKPKSYSSDHCRGARNAGLFRFKGNVQEFSAAARNHVSVLFVRRFTKSS